MLKIATFFCCLISAAHAATLNLNDGSKITGKINGLTGGIYTVETTSLGVLQIPQAKISSIQYDDNQAVQTNQDIDNTVGALQQQIEQNPQLLNNVKELKHETDVQAVLNDPTVMDSVKSGDFGALMGNEKVQNLMNNPKIKALADELQQVK